MSQNQDYVEAGKVSEISNGQRIIVQVKKQTLYNIRQPKPYMLPTSKGITSNN
jgi:hypothetical protein